MGLPFSSGLAEKPATMISQLVIDVNKNFIGPAITHTPAWALPSYFYRKKFTVNGTVAGAQVNYQVPLTIHYFYGVDAGNDVYLNRNVMSDFTDIRFVNSAGALLDFWVDSYDVFQARVWVELDNIPIAPGTADFWLYYGNSYALNASNGPATFLQFNSGNTVVGWTDVTVAGAGNINWAVNAGRIRGTSSAVNGAAFLFSTAVTGINSYRMHVHTLAQDGLTASDYRQGFVDKVGQNNVDRGQAYWRDSTNIWYIVDDAGGISTSPADADFDARAEHEYILVRIPTESQLYVDNNLKVTRAVGAWSPQDVGLYIRTVTSGHYADFWNFFVANYADPEPTIGAWDPEEIKQTIYGLFNLKELALGMIEGDVLFFDGVQLAISSPGTIGTEFTTHGPGVDPTWEYPP
jgi:hypothetical protein